MPSALVLLAAGAEEMEAVITIDVLRRGNVDVTVAGIAGPGVVECSRKVKVQPDVSLDAVQDKAFDAVILPGGLGGANALAQCGQVGAVLQAQEKAGRIVAAICAAPTALMAHKIGSGKTVTSYPKFKDDMVKGGYKYSEDQVVQDGQLITSRGPGTAFEFGLKLVEVLNHDAAQIKELKEQMLLH